MSTPAAYVEKAFFQSLNLVDISSIGLFPIFELSLTVSYARCSWTGVDLFFQTCWQVVVLDIPQNHFQELFSVPRNLARVC